MKSYSETLFGQIDGILTKCAHAIYDISRDWSTDDLGQLTQEEWDASRPIYIASGLSQNAHRLSIIAGQVQVAAEARMILGDATPEQMPHRIEMLQLFLGKVRRVKKAFDCFSGKTGHIDFPSAKIDESFEHAALSIINSTWGIIDCIDPILNPISKAQVRSSQPIAQTKVEPHTEAKTKQYVRSILEPLGGLNPQNEPIMSDDDFRRLIGYTDHLVLTNTLPENINQIAQTGISNEHIRYTYYRLHLKLFGTKRKRESFPKFLHAVFRQFSGTMESTTFQKLSVAPKSYKKDFTGYIGEDA